MPTCRALTVMLAALAWTTAAGTARAGDAEDLHRIVREWRTATGGAGEALVGWSLPRAQAALHGLVRDRPGAWGDGELLATAMFLTVRGQREMRLGGSGGDPWFALAEQALDRVAEPKRRRALQRDWTLALAAFHNSRFDGGSSRRLLDRAVDRQSEDAELLFAAARVHEAIGGRAFSGLVERAEGAAADAVQADLLAALQRYQRVIQLAPRPEVLLRCGRVLSLLRRGREAVGLLEPLRGSAAGDVACLAALFQGVVSEQEGHPATALACYREAVASGRSPQAARLALARLLRGTGDAAGARATVEEMLADGEAADAWARYQHEGFGDDASHAERFAVLWREARQ